MSSINPKACKGCGGIDMHYPFCTRKDDTEKSTPVQADKEFCDDVGRKCDFDKDGVCTVCSFATPDWPPKENNTPLNEDLEERVERLILGTGEYYGLSNYDRGGYIQPILNLIRERETAARWDEVNKAVLKAALEVTGGEEKIGSTLKYLEARLKELE